MVTNYSRRAISFESDRLAAISGLASLIERHLGATYLAGIWKEDIRSLLWFRDITRPDSKIHNATSPAVRRSHFPSWSWAAATGPIRYRYEEAIPSEHDATILSYNFPSFSAHRLAGGSCNYLVLRARSRTLNYRGSFDPYGNRGYFRTDLYQQDAGSYSGLSAGVGYMDFEVDEEYKGTKTQVPLHPCNALWIIEQRGDPYQTFVPGVNGLKQQKIEYIKSPMCLLVERVDEPLRGNYVQGRERWTSWRRIGVAKMKDTLPQDGEWSEIEHYAII